jgi:nitrogen fixation regulatory protein
LRSCIPDQTMEAFQPVNIQEIIANVLKFSTALLLGSNIVVNWQTAKNCDAILGYPTQLSNLFKQLISNAVEAINEQRGSRRELRIDCVSHPDCIEIFLEDTGPGIADDLRFKVFQPFFTTKGAGQQHLGLGLAMAQDVVTRHGGTIDIEPQNRNGCRVRVQLPRMEGVHHD